VVVRITEWGVKFKKVNGRDCLQRVSSLCTWYSTSTGNDTANYKKIYIIDFWFPLQINITLKSEMPVQIDGEPWMQGAGSVIVRPILTQVLLND